MEVLGFPLEKALQCLKGTGKQITTIEVRSRKGSKGDDSRVIRVVDKEDETIVYWAYFQTKTE
jgi:hypothetical protein